VRRRITAADGQRQFLVFRPSEPIHDQHLMLPVDPRGNVFLDAACTVSPPREVFIEANGGHPMGEKLDIL